MQISIVRLIIILAVGLSIPLAALTVIVAFDKAQVSEVCDRFGQESGYNTRYVEYTFWNYDCIAKQDNGKWISSSLLREVSQ